MEERPKLKIELSPADKMVEIAGWFSVAGIWMLTLLNYNSLPDIIPVHFNGAGAPDSFDTKQNILALPVILTLMFLGMSVLNLFPHIFNYPAKVTKENALKQYINATRLIRYLKLSIVILFGFIVYATIQTAKGQADGLGYWFLPTTLLLTFGPLAWFIVKSFRIKPN